MNAFGDLIPGSKLGKYEILRRIAAGGMAEIFLARVSGLQGFNKLVVIKRILPQLAQKQDFVEMFLDEARIAATLEHPNIVQVYDVGVVQNNYFIAMEYLYGEDVRSLTKILLRQQERIPLEHALQIMIGLCSGLHYAHERLGFDGKPLNIVHRDVTPQNVIVTFEGGVKLLDFGIAKASNRFGETRFGTLKGKVPYMSPEQCKGEPLDRRSDIFSLGIMLYELTLGKRLYQGTSDFDILKQIVEGTVTPPSKLDPSYPPALERIVLGALEKDRGRRFQTAQVMQHELEALVRQERIYLSQSVLKQFMEQTFAEKVTAWRKAEREGKSLDEFLHAAARGGEFVERFSDVRSSRRSPSGAHPTNFPAPPLEDPMPTATSVPVNLRPKAGKGFWLIAGGAVGIAAIAFIAVFSRHRHPVPAPDTVPTSPSVAAPADPSPTPSTTPSTKVVDNKPTAPTPAPVPNAPVAGALRVTTAPAGATLYLDGRKLDALSPTTIEKIPAGIDHTLEVKRQGFEPATQTVSVRAGESLQLVVRLNRGHDSSHASVGTKTAAFPKERKVEREKPAPASRGGNGNLVLASEPWCNISIDGQDHGQTPLSQSVPAGSHTVVCQNPEFHLKKTFSINVKAGETVRKRITLE